MSESGIDKLSRTLGVQRTYTDGTGTERTAPDDAVRAVFELLGVDGSTDERAHEEASRIERERAEQVCEPTTVVWQTDDPALRLAPAAAAAGSLRITIDLEDGGAITIDGARDRRIDTDEGASVALPGDVPAGFHALRVEADGRTETGTLIVARPKCFKPEQGATDIGVFLPLYAVRSDGSAGVGTYSDLSRLSGWARSHGASLTGTLPLLATFLDDPFEPSPYMPVSRCVFSELFIDAQDAAGRFPLPKLKELLWTEGARANAERLAREPLVKYRESWRLVRSFLETAEADVRENQALRDRVDAFVASDPLISAYAEFRAQTYLPPGRTREDELLLYHAAQFLVHDQLSRAADDGSGRSALYLDLPVGSHALGFDGHRHPGVHASGASMGAPPDALFRQGQSWGFPPVLPGVSRALGHKPFRESIERHLRYAGALRIDHAAGLFRSYWVPDGFSATDGLYVENPAEELLATLSVLSHRHESRIIGEDLGTVPKEFTDTMRSRDLLNMRVAQFELGNEQHPVPEPNAGSLACVNTHDTPTFAAYWSGDDLRLNTELGVFPPEDVEPSLRWRGEMRERTARALLGEVDGDPDPAEVLEGLLERLAGSDADILLINLEDLWLEERPQNVPGVVDGHPAWRQRAARTLDSITKDRRIADLLGRVARAANERG